MKRSLSLLNQLIEIETEKDKEFKKEMLSRRKGQQCLGESQLLFHLKILRELISTEWEEAQKIR